MKVIDLYNINMPYDKIMDMIKKESIPNDGYFDWFQFLEKYISTIYEKYNIEIDDIHQKHKKEIHNILDKCFPFQQGVPYGMMQIFDKIPRNWAEGYWTEGSARVGSIRFPNAERKVMFTSERDLFNFRLTFM